MYCSRRKGASAMSTGAERPTFIISFQSDGHNLISAWTGCWWSPGKTRRKTAGGVAAVLNFTGNTGSGVCVCCKRAKRGQGPDRTGQIVLYAQNGTRLNCFENGEANGREGESSGDYSGGSDHWSPLLTILFPKTSCPHSSDGTEFYFSTGKIWNDTGNNFVESISKVIAISSTGRQCCHRWKRVCFKKSQMSK